MKTAFEVVPMGELCEISSGESDTKDAVVDGPYAFFDRSKTIKRSSRYLYDCEALIIPGEGKEFLPKHFKGKFDLHQRAYALFGFDPRLDIRFLFHFLHYRSDYFPSVAVGATVKSLRRRHFEQLPVPVPSLAEQQRIVTILDEAFEGIATAKANAEQNLRTARHLFDSYLQAVFANRSESWTERRLGELSRIQYGYTKSASFDKIGPHFLRITDLKDDGVDWQTVPYCRIAEYDLPKYQLADGDIVFARTGATTGKSYLVIDPPESVFASYLIRVRLKTKEVTPQFVNLFFKTQSYWSTIRSGVAGSAQGGFNASKLADLSVPFPRPIAEQVATVVALERVAAECKRLAAVFERKVIALEALWASLLHQAFSGQL